MAPISPQVPPATSADHPVAPDGPPSTLLILGQQATAEVHAALATLSSHISDWSQTLRSLHAVVHGVEGADLLTTPELALQSYRALFDGMADLAELVDPFAMDLRHSPAVLNDVR